jgi:DNA-binding Lrp family transcriptional regulator
MMSKKNLKDIIKSQAETSATRIQDGYNWRNSLFKEDELLAGVADISDSVLFTPDGVNKTTDDVLFTSHDVQNTTTGVPFTSDGVKNTSYGVLNTPIKEVSTLELEIMPTADHLINQKPIVTDKMFLNTNMIKDGINNTPSDVLFTSNDVSNTPSGVLFTTDEIPNTLDEIPNISIDVLNTPRGVTFTPDDVVTTLGDVLNTPHGVFNTPIEDVSILEPGIISATDSLISQMPITPDETLLNIYITKSGVTNTPSGVPETTKGVLDTSRDVPNISNGVDKTPSKSKVNTLKNADKKSHAFNFYLIGLWYTLKSIFKEGYGNYTIRELAKQLQIDHSNLLRYLKRAEDAGFIRRVSLNNGTYLEVMPDLVLFPDEQNAHTPSFVVNFNNPNFHSNFELRENLFGVFWGILAAKRQPEELSGSALEVLIDLAFKRDEYYTAAFIFKYLPRSKLNPATFFKTILEKEKDPLSALEIEQGKEIINSAQNLFNANPESIGLATMRTMGKRYHLDMGASLEECKEILQEIKQRFTNLVELFKK